MAGNYTKKCEIPYVYNSGKYLSTDIACVSTRYSIAILCRYALNALYEITILLSQIR